jgi:AbrB family looped-hinge helix DNA binding protein
MDATIVMGKQGRVVIPAEIRQQLGLTPGDHLHLRLAGTRLVI